MKTKKPRLMMNGHTDEVQTPKVAIESLLPYLEKEWVIWECAWGGGSLARHLSDEDFEVKGKSDLDFLNDTELRGFDCIVTNPPFSKKEAFLKRAFEIGKPFAFLMPITALVGQKRMELYKKYGIQIIIPKKRINYIMPNKQGSAWFHSAWFCYKLGLPKQINFAPSS